MVTKTTHPATSTSSLPLPQPSPSPSSQALTRPMIMWGLRSSEMPMVVSREAIFLLGRIKPSTALLSHHTNRTLVNSKANIKISRTNNRTSPHPSLRTNNVQDTMSMIPPRALHDNFQIRTLVHLSVKLVRSIVNRLPILDSSQTANRSMGNRIVISKATCPISRISRAF